MPAARRLATVATLAVVALVGACSDEPEPRFAEPSESAPNTGSPFISDPQVSERESVEDFIQTVSDALGTGDTRALREMTDTQCGNCDQLIDNVETSFADGRSVVGASWTPKSIEPNGESELGHLWLVQVRTSEERYLDASGVLVKRTPATELMIEIAVQDDAKTPIRSFRLS